MTPAEYKKMGGKVSKNGPKSVHKSVPQKFPEMTPPDRPKWGLSGTGSAIVTPSKRAVCSESLHTAQVPAPVG